jgi:hypothetical protein
MITPVEKGGKIAPCNAKNQQTADSSALSPQEKEEDNHKHSCYR